MRYYTIEPDDEDELFDDFIRWRVKKRDSEAEAGRKLPPVTVRDGQGKLVIMREELARECREFLGSVMDAHIREFAKQRVEQLEQNGFQDVADKDEDSEYE